MGSRPDDGIRDLVEHFPRSAVPTLQEFGKDSKPTVAAWFTEHTGAEVQCEAYMRSKKVSVVLEYLQTYFQFPFESEALRKHARRKGWI